MGRSRTWQWNFPWVGKYEVVVCVLTSLHACVININEVKAKANNLTTPRYILFSKVPSCPRWDSNPRHSASMYNYRRALYQQSYQGNSAGWGSNLQHKANLKTALGMYTLLTGKISRGMLIATPCTALRILAKFYEAVWERKVSVVSRRKGHRWVAAGAIVLVEHSHSLSV